MPLLGAIAGCHRSVLWLGGEGDDQLWGSGRGAIAGCHCSVLWLVGEGDDQLWGSGRGAIAGCHCSVLWLGEAFFFTLTTQKLFFAIWGLCGSIKRRLLVSKNWAKTSDFC